MELIEVQELGQPLSRGVFKDSRYRDRYVINPYAAFGVFPAVAEPAVLEEISKGLLERADDPDVRNLILYIQKKILGDRLVNGKVINERNDLDEQLRRKFDISSLVLFQNKNSILEFMGVQGQFDELHERLGTVDSSFELEANVKGYGSDFYGEQILRNTQEKIMRNAEKEFLALFKGAHFGIVRTQVYAKIPLNLRFPESYVTIPLLRSDFARGEYLGENFGLSVKFYFEAYCPRDGKTFYNGR